MSKIEGRQNNFYQKTSAPLYKHALDCVPTSSRSKINFVFNTHTPQTYFKLRSNGHPLKHLNYFIKLKTTEII